MMEVYLGIDVGSVTTKLALVGGERHVLATVYLRTLGAPVAAVQSGLEQIERQIPGDGDIQGVGVTGSARYLAGALVGADVVRNEITAQAVGALQFVPDVRTIVEIGGQDSKLVLVRQGMVVDFAMNAVCAAGTGSFLEQQALRLGVSVEDFGDYAMRSRRPVSITGSCTVFAESDMIHKQQMGYRKEDIIYGLCQALVRNYLNDVVRGKEVAPPVMFQGGVAFNKGIIRALEESLETRVIVPPHREAIGAIGAALLAMEERTSAGSLTSFRGFEARDASYRTSTFECQACSKLCEVAQLMQNDEVLARWGGRCDLWEGTKIGQTESI